MLIIMIVVYIIAKYDFSCKNNYLYYQYMKKAGSKDLILLISFTLQGFIRCGFVKQRIEISFILWMNVIHIFSFLFFLE